MNAMDRHGIVRAMNWKTLALVLALVSWVAATSPAATVDTEDQPVRHNALRKLCRGCANLLFGITELPHQIIKTTTDQGGAAGCTYGVGKGLARFVARELVGAYEVISFPVPYPRGYKPVMKPEWPTADFEP